MLRRSALELADGRKLSWYEFGDPGGVPCVYMPGTPESGIAGGCYDRAARQAGVRWISVDKPGYGHSDSSPGRRLTEWPRDVSELADHLELGQFAVAGESGGGPHALAVAHDLGERIRVVILLASAGVVPDGTIPLGMTSLNTLLFRCLRISPWLVHLLFAGVSFSVRNEASFPRLVGMLGRGIPEVDIEAMSDPEYEARLAAGADAFRQGGRPAAEEFIMVQGPWGFGPSSITVPVHMWHGRMDAHVPFSMAVELSGELPNVVTHFLDDAGHMVGFQCRDAVMEAVQTDINQE